MIHCIVPRCTWRNNSLQRLHDHLNKYHGNLQIYECNVGDCTRKYNVKYSFYRHFKTHFNESSNVETIETKQTPLDIKTNDFTTTLAENYHPVIRNNPATNTHESPGTNNAPYRQPEQDLLYVTTLNDLIKKMEQANIDFNLKYLNINTIPRKIVFDIQKDIKSIIIDPLSEAIHIMRSLGFVTEEGQSIFSNMLSAVKEVKSEYKFLMRLKELDLFVDPKEFVISDELHPGIVHNEQIMDNDPVTGIVFLDNIYNQLIHYTYMEFYFRHYFTHQIHFEEVFGIQKCHGRRDEQYRSLC